MVFIVESMNAVGLRDPLALKIKLEGVHPDAAKLIVMGADSLSCSWINKKVAVNYRKTGENEGKLATLELE